MLPAAEVDESGTLLNPAFTIKLDALAKAFVHFTQKFAA
jgi:hypothetical protein